MASYNLQFRIIRTHTTVYQMAVDSDHPPTTEDIKNMYQPAVKVISEIEDTEHRVDWTVTYDRPRPDDSDPRPDPDQIRN